MLDDIRRTIDELIARYELEPNLNDVYVEGEFDIDIFHSTIDARECNLRIYSIDSVDVPCKILQKHALTDGNKQRVIALAKELEQCLVGEFDYLCLTDKDLDYWFGKLEVIRNHKWTQYTSLEMHFFEKSYMQHFLTVVARVKINNFNGFYEQIASILRWKYAFRCVDHEMDLCLRWIPIDKCVKKHGGDIVFDFDEYIKRTLNKSGKMDYIDKVNKGINQWLDKFEKDDRQCIRGHDFVEIMKWAISKLDGYGELANQVTILRIFVNSARNFGEIRQEIAAQFT